MKIQISATVTRQAENYGDCYRDATYPVAINEDETVGSLVRRALATGGNFHLYGPAENADLTIRAVEDRFDKEN